MTYSVEIRFVQDGVIKEMTCGHKHRFYYTAWKCKKKHESYVDETEYFWRYLDKTFAVERLKRHGFEEIRQYNPGTFEHGIYKGCGFTVEIHSGGIIAFGD